MKKTVVVVMSLVLVSFLAMGLAIAKPVAAKGPSTKKTVVKTSRATDKLLIKQAIYKRRHATTSGIVDRGKPYASKVKFVPIEFVDNWATTSLIFYPIEHHKDDDEGAQNDSYLLLKKSNGHWKIVAQYYGGSMKPAKAKAIGLPKTVAKHLNIRITPTASPTTD